MENHHDLKTSPKALTLLKILWGSLPPLFFIAAIIILAILISSKSAALKEEKAAALKQEEPATNVVTIKATPMPIRDRINLPGVIEPWIKLTLLSEVSGKVVRKVKDEGSSVQKGELIAVIDARDYENTLISAKASYHLALVSKERMEKLYREKLSTRSQLDDAEAMLETSKARMDSAALNVERCSIRSPLSGILNKLHIESGDYLNITAPVADILQIDKVKVTIGIPESDVHAIRRIDHFEVKIDALHGSIYPAKKHFLSKSTDTFARLYDLVVTIDNPEGKILPDMFARVEIVKQKIDHAITLPIFSIITINNDHIAYVVKDNIVQARKIELGMQEGWKVQVTEGIQPDEHVVVVGQRSVNEGQKVNVIKTISHLEELSG
ncbi:MAG: efflux RND transporter periplasmic adaptor subunit [Desulfobacteraceae bacterium]|nr:MAG: efflux RND transporter periplasmic adaptor subunit [Desulfobacteraceae bacterium]